MDLKTISTSYAMISRFPQFARTISDIVMFDSELNVLSSSQEDTFDLSITTYIAPVLLQTDKNYMAL